MALFRVCLCGWVCGGRYPFVQRECVTGVERVGGAARQAIKSREKPNKPHGIAHAPIVSYDVWGGFKEIERNM